MRCPRINEDSSGSSILDTFSEAIDSHLRLFRLLPWVVGVTGLALIYKHSRHHVKRFRRVTEVPHSCLTAQVPLYGVVVAVEMQSIGVWHVPLWWHWTRVGHKRPRVCSHEELLWLTFAGVEMNDVEVSTAWLHTRLIGRGVTFIPVAVCGDKLLSIIYARKWVRRVSVNRELVSRGVARPHNLEELPVTKESLKLIHSLMASDLRTKKRWFPW